MIILVKGDKYEFDENKLMTVEARLIKKNTGMGIAEWGEAIQKGDPDALIALIFLAKKRAGEAPRWNDFDDLDLINDIDVESDPDDDEPRAEEAPGKLEKPAAKKTAGKTPKVA